MKTSIVLGLCFLFSVHAATAQSSVSGYALNVQTGQPLAGALVTLKNESGLSIEGIAPVRTGALGSYEIRDIPAGRYQIRASTILNVQEDSLGYELISRPVELEPGGQQIHFGFSLLSPRLRIEHQSRGESGAPDTSPEWEAVRSFLLRSTIVDGSGQNLIHSENGQWLRSGKGWVGHF